MWWLLRVRFFFQCKRKKAVPGEFVHSTLNWLFTRAGTLVTVDQFDNKLVVYWRTESPTHDGQEIVTGFPASWEIDN